MTVGERMRYIREQRGLTLEELGKKAGVQKAAIHKYESGINTNIPTKRLQLIAIALDVSPAYLMGWVEEPSPALTQEERKRKELIQAIVANLERMSPEVLQRFLALIESFLTAPKA